MSEKSILASKLRKEFHKQFTLSLGDLIQANGVIGKFDGISTYDDPSQITTRIRTIVEEIDIQQTDIKILPEDMQYGYQRIPIRYVSTTPTEFPQHL